ncbi:MAG: enoyl-CoA hydratase/isomerase family protein [Gammaproteobacteria bacterium]|nr:enoyl-CoA hydratase/isomerase family protein [Gammaproteobacteria bacterium]MBQ0838448.1 enoyl-CoA hydratase/isomerase family protein [Gammaproteobacteria bacterium]
MSNTVNFSKQGSIGLIKVNNPPVNALNQSVRAGLKTCVEQGLADDGVKAMVLICEGRTFIAGADINEFAKGMGEPGLVPVIGNMETADKPIVAAIHGTALGGGLEVALGCHYRVALASAKVGLPEVHLGLLPGAGGTQRLPRLVGAQAALELIVGGGHVAAAKAAELGIIDAIVEGDLETAAIAYAEKLLAEGTGPRAIRDITPEAAGPEVFDNFEKSIARKQRGFLAPFHIIKSIRAAFELPFDEGMARESELFMELMTSSESAAQRHIFFAEREVAKVPGLARDTVKRDINCGAVVGAGTMGGGIAMNFANAGIPVKLLEMKQEFLDKGIALIRKNYENTAKKGRISMADVEKRMALIEPTLSYDDIKDVDIVIEAVFENMDVKKEVFKKLDSVCRPGAILASNTSTLDVDEIANVTGRPQDVIGMHFFSPANVMRLLENVRGEKTADDVIATVMSFSKRIGKIGAMVGVCDGFVGNRMLHQRTRESAYLVEEGASPEQVDKVLFDFGFPMGAFTMADMAGLDVGYKVREERRKAGKVEKRDSVWIDKIVEMGRHGQKTNAGVYKYEDGRTPIPDPVVKALIAECAKEAGIEQRDISDQEILERCLYPMINEGAKILEEGIAARPLDIDIIWINGYGFPGYKGGPMFWADQIGLQNIVDAYAKYAKQFGDHYWQPAPLLAKLAKEGKGFYDL